MQSSRLGIAAFVFVTALGSAASAAQEPPPVAPSQPATSTATATATSSAPASGAPADKPAPSNKGEEDEGVAFGVIGGLGFPRPFMVEGLLRVDQSASFGVEYSAMPKTTLAGVEARFWAVSLDARVYPLRSAFYIGLRGGSQHLQASMSASVPGVGTLTEGMEISTLFVNPRLGFMWGTAPGIAAGFEVGVQIPVSTSVSSTLPPQLAATGTAGADSGLVSITNIFGKNVLPTVDILKIGVLL